MYRTYRRAYRTQGKPLPWDPVVRPVAYAVVSAVIGTQSTLQAKCLSGLLVSPDAGQALGDGFTYLTLAGFLLGTAFWLYRMNRALALFEPLFIIPVLQVFWTFFATLNGGIYFREFMGADFLAHSIGGFISGVFVIFFGVYLLAPKTSSGAGTNPPSTAATANSTGGQSGSPLDGKNPSIDGRGDLGGKGLSPQLRPVCSLIHELDQGLPDLDSRLAKHEAALVTTQSSREDGSASASPSSASSLGSDSAASSSSSTATTAGGTAFPVTTRGAQAVAELLEEAQLLIFGDETLLHGTTSSSAGSGISRGLLPSRRVPTLNGQGAYAFPGAVGSAPTWGGGNGGAPSYKPRLVSFVGDLPVLIAHEHTARAFEHLIPTLDGMHDSDEES